jgi:AbrB family looped-hinge helix DNA binding protein
MSKVTSKLQVTLPKALAEKLGIRPGDEIEWVIAGRTLRIIPGGAATSLDVDERLELFDAATARQRVRERRRAQAKRPQTRGWTRDELYDRGRAR